MGSPKGDDADRANEKPEHSVTIGQAFALMTTEVTRDQFAAFVKATQREMSGGCYLADGGDGKWNDNADWLHADFQQKGNEPAICVSWGDAAGYAEWLSQKTGKHYRLPTEAEWEYAARAGKKTAWPWGDGDIENGCKFANTIDASGHKKYPINESLKCDDHFVATAPVGSFPANKFGLKDMIGNVWEWVEDCYHPTYKGAPTDGAASDDGDDCKERVARGGAWLENAWDSRFASRYNVEHTGRENILGFRLARDLD
jgi:formylglycine-generating enzyme required for sulfatase activity